MKKSAFLLSALVVAVGASSAAPARADANAAFCMVGYGTTDSRECNYYTLAQCQSASRGVGGLCFANPGSASARQRGQTMR
jgi:hypothetical protein